MLRLSPFRRKLLLSKLSEDFKQINKKVEFINYGGCGIFAEYVYDLLIKLGYKVDIIITTRNSYATKEGISNNCRAVDTPFNHIVLLVEGFYIDATGVNTELSDNTKSLVTGMPYNLLKDWNTQLDGWNPTFNRKVYIPVIKKELKKIEKSLVN